MSPSKKAATADAQADERLSDDELRALSMEGVECRTCGDTKVVYQHKFDDSGVEVAKRELPCPDCEGW